MPKTDQTPNQSTQWVPAGVRTEDEIDWASWLKKGRDRDHAGYARRIQWLKAGLAVLLLAAAGFWLQPPPFEAVLRLVVAIGAFTLMVQALRSGSYAFAALFGATVLLFNPVLPVFDFTGNVPRALVLATAIPLLLSLGWSKPRQALS